MNITEIDARLKAALPLRIPRFNPSDAPGLKIAALEEHMRTAAYHRAELEEALHWAWEAQKLLREQWTDVQGWQSLAGSKPTQASIDQAKRVCSPAIWSAIQDVKLLLASLERQIKRLDKEADIASRSYTLISGG